VQENNLKPGYNGYLPSFWIHSILIILSMDAAWTYFLRC
jgi:hypothetical protein